MRQPSASDAEEAAYNLGTLFGVKGPLRLLPQGVAPKAHILLKREFLGETDTNEDPTSGPARFTFVANKRFTASKGQTMLISVVDPTSSDQNLLLDDNTLSIEFDFDDEIELSDGEEEVVEEDRTLCKAANKEQRGRNIETLPPKMRKSLMGTKTYTNFTAHEPPDSLGFSGYPLYAPPPRVFSTVSVQTDTPAVTILSPSKRPTTPIIDNANKSPLQLPSPISADDRPHLDASGDDTDHSLRSDQLPPSPTSADGHTRESQLDAQDDDVMHFSERSLSPMEMSTPSSSTRSSPAPRPQKQLTESGTGSVKATDSVASMATTEQVSRSVKEEIIEMQGIEDHLGKDVCTVTPAPVQELDNTTFDTEPAQPEVSVLPAPSAPVKTPIPEPAASEEDATISNVPPQEMEADSTTISKEANPVPSPQKPMLIEKKVAVSAKAAASSNKLPSDKTSTSPSAATSAPLQMTPSTPSMPRAMSQHISRAQDKSPTCENKTAASSLPTPVSSTKVASSASWDNPSPSPNTCVPMPAPSTSNPLGIRPSMHPLAGPSQRPPPKAPRSLWGASTGLQAAPTFVAASNAASTVGLTCAQTQAPTPIATPQPKKPVVVGSKWSAMRGSSAVASSSQGTNSGAASTLSSVTVDSSESTSTSVPPSASLVAPSTALGTKANLSQMLRYSASPSPPPPPALEPPPTPSSPPKGKEKAKDEVINHPQASSASDGNKWKRISPVDGPGALVSKSIAPVKRNTAMPDPQGSKAVNGANNASTIATATAKKRPRNVFDEEDDNLPSTLHPAKSDSQGQVAKKAKPTLGVNTMPMTASSSLSSVSSATSNASMNTAKAGPITQKLPQPLNHPLPPKPALAVMVSSYDSYRPIKRERSRSRERSWTPEDERVARSERSARSEMSEWERERERSKKEAKDREREREREREQERARERERDRESRNERNWPSTNPLAEHQLQGATSADLAVMKIVFGELGERVAIICADRTLRIWERKPQLAEVARLAHNTAIVAACWVTKDLGVLTLGMDGIVNTWVRNGNEWSYRKLLSVNDGPTLDVPVSMIFAKDRIAVSTLTGVKVWLLISGTWQKQRDIMRSGVTAIRFVQDGTALIGGCRDGTLWYCEVPNGTLRAYAFMPKGKGITSFDVHPNGMQLLVGQEGGTAYLIPLRPNENKGTIEKTYTSDKVQMASAQGSRGYPAIFATKGQAVLFGMTNGCALVWDRKKGSIVYGLKHLGGDTVQAMASFDSRPGIDGIMVSGTKEGRLFWWPCPQAAPSHNSNNSASNADEARKRQKLGS